MIFKGILIVENRPACFGFYIIKDIDIISGQIINTVEASATGPNQLARITDISDDGDDTDGNTLDDPTVVYLH